MIYLLIRTSTLSVFSIVAEESAAGAACTLSLKKLIILSASTEKNVMSGRADNVRVSLGHNLIWPKTSLTISKLRMLKGKTHARNYTLEKTSLHLSL